MVAEVIDAVELPEAVQRGAVSTIDDPIEVMPGYSGLEQRNQKSPTRRRREWTIGYGIKTQAERQAIIDLYNTNGQTIGFLHRDWADDTVTVQNIGTGDGSNRSFLAKKRYVNAASRYLDRRLTRLVATGIVVKVDGTVTTFFTLPGLGVILFDSGHTPASGKAVELTYARFLVPVRFNGKLQIRVDTANKISIPTVNLIELFETASD